MTINSYAAQGKQLPPRKDAPLSDAPSTLNSQPSTRRQNWLGPRFEPSNISSYATIQSVQAAIREAENGETTSLFRFYRDALLGDDHVQGEINKRKLAVIGQPLTVLPADKTSEDDQRAAAACLRAIKDCENWNPALANLLGSSQWPVTLAENIFRPADPMPVSYSGPSTLNTQPSTKQFPLQFTLKRIEPVNPMLFCFRHAYLVGGVGMGSATPVQLGDLGSLNPQPSTPVAQPYPVPTGPADPAGPGSQPQDPAPTPSLQTQRERAVTPITVPADLFRR